MVATEFQVIVSGDTVSGVFRRPGQPPMEMPTATLAVDTLTLSTVAVMDRWLNFWKRIVDRDEIRHRSSLFERQTFEVVGESLWRLILENPVGASLKRHLDEPGDQPLRLVLTFTNQASTLLRGLPWEFLHVTPHGFLAAKTGMLLTRYVYLDGNSTGRRAVTPVQNDQLRVLLLAALPDVDRFGNDRDRLRKLWEQLKKNVGAIDALDPIYSWKRDDLRAVLANRDKPCHVVHVLGLCRGEPGAPKLYLGTEGFQDPQELISVLCADPESTPQLVVLQLCDDVDGDASENFERLAPALIERGVPAVLALQYAAMPDDVGVGVDFYRSLTEGEAVGAAVQKSRSLLVESVDRRFATPVLYLGTDGALRKPPDSTSPATLSRQHDPRGGPPGVHPVSDVDIRDRMIDLVRYDRDLDPEQRTRLINWIASMQLGSNPIQTAAEKLRLEIRDAADDPTRVALGRLLDDLVRPTTSAGGGR